MDREKVIKAVETCFDSWIDKHRNMGLDLQTVEQMKRDALALLKESVHKGVVDQIQWERDIALSQLEQIGKGLGSKMDDIVAMLKEQEPTAAEGEIVKPIDKGDGSYACDKCGETIGWDEMECYGISPVRYKFCPECGREVKWDE